MEKKAFWDALKLILIYIVLYVLSVVVLVLLFHTPLFQNVDVLMYRGIILIFVSSIIAAGFMFLIKKLWDNKVFIMAKDMILLFFACCCINLAWFTLIPVTVERSVSVFMLSYMEENSETAFTQTDVENIFVEKYVNDYGAFEKRFHEQVVTGSIAENDDGTYSITRRGRFIVNLFRIIADWFQTDKRLVYPNEN